MSNSGERVGVVCLPAYAKAVKQDRAVDSGSSKQIRMSCSVDVLNRERILSGIRSTGQCQPDRLLLVSSLDVIHNLE